MRFGNQGQKLPQTEKAWTVNKGLGRQQKWLIDGGVQCSTFEGRGAGWELKALVSLDFTMSCNCNILHKSTYFSLHVRFKIIFNFPSVELVIFFFQIYFCYTHISVILNLVPLAQFAWYSVSTACIFFCIIQDIKKFGCSALKHTLCDSSSPRICFETFINCTKKKIMKEFK